ncbi:MAG: TonB-dependent receptor [Opitutales bacterium]
MHLPTSSSGPSKFLGLLPLAACVLFVPLYAQTPPLPDETPVQLARFEVTGLPLADSINPLTRETDAVMGDGRGPLDTPRSVSTITSGLMNGLQIHGLADVLTYAAGAYTDASYGMVTTPNIRGDLAETYLNGQRLSYNFYGYFPSFNGIEAIDVVSGPGSVVFGAGYLTGGYVNYVTKQPSFAGPATTVTVRFGTLAPGHTSYPNASVQLDTTAPVSDKLAWRLSYEGQSGQTFFRQNGARDDRQDIFGALTWKPQAGTTVDFNAQFFWQNTPETLGVNRVTQDLVWHDLYYTGQSADLVPYPGPIPATGVVKLPWDAIVFSRGDFSNADVARAQLVVTRDVSPTLTVTNRTLFEYVNRRRYQQFEYAEYVTQHTFENRTELHFDWSTAALPQTVVAGVTLRYVHTLAYENYFNEYVYNFDITDPTRVFNAAAEFPNSYYPGLPGPGGRLFFPSAWGSPETDNSTLWNPAAFWQHDLHLTSRLELILGLRGDAFLADARDPLPPPDTTPWHATASVLTASPSANLLYHVTPRFTLYTTYQRIRAAAGNLGGGGISLTDNGTGVGVINRHDLLNRSDLLEAGAKWALLDNRLFATAAAFDQERTQIGIMGEHDDLRIRGLELSTVYQPDARFSATANATWQDGAYVNTAPFQLGGASIYDAYLLGMGPGGLGTSTGTYDPYANQVPVGNYPLVGFSKVMLNASMNYRFANGWGAGLKARWQSPQRGNLADQWHIPSQYTLNATLSYEAKTWSANLDLLNLTDQRNWIHNGDAYTASELIFPELPFRLEGSVKFKF